MSRDKWSGRATFILASIGSAVGLGNAWRFPGLCAKFGGGAFLMAYIICMLIIGIPLLMMEIAIGRKSQGGAPKAMRFVNKKAEPVGWAATANAFVILTYYAVVFAWCILMCFVAYKFATTADTTETASTLWQNSIGATFKTSFFGDGGNIKLAVLICVGIAWALIYGCIRNGASQVGKVVKYTVFLPVIMLLILAIKGFINNPNLGEALKALFVPDWSAFAEPKLWVNAMGQSFYSLSVMMAIMFAYGSYLKKSANIAADTMIIAFSDLAISVLSGIVLFTTMYQTGLSTSNMSDSGIATAYIIYPTAIVNLTSVGWINAVFGFIFYFMLCTLAIDSAFSILEGVAAAVCDKFKLPKRKTTLYIAIIAAIISIVYTTGAGIGYLDIVDNWTNQYTLIIIGVLETIVVGWLFNTNKVLTEINKNTKKFKMPKWWFNISIKFIAPAALTFLFIWQFVVLIQNGFRYNTDYNLAAEIIAGWVVTILVFASGFIIKLIMKRTKRGIMIQEMEKTELTWNDMADETYPDEVLANLEPDMEPTVEEVKLEETPKPIEE
ncbi:MAG: sodium-dependent transporter [Acholeplasmatales bacterium]|nr:sodium-dependent transporter [Acholeplasmatales bacterium]